MERLKMCPLLSRPHQDTHQDQQWECYADTCAWYINGKCAVVIIAEKIETDNRNESRTNR